MTTMQALQFDRYGEPEVLHVASVPVPTLRPGEVLVRVAAASVNAADTIFRSGKLRLLTGRRFPRGTGYDFAGEVVELGEGVTGFSRGMQVWGFAHPRLVKSTGAAAEFIAIPAGAISRRPSSLDPVSAAALPGAAGAALGALRDVLALRPGERVLIRGAAGGVGSAAVQIVKALGGRPVALGGAAHAQALRELGAEEVFDHRSIAAGSLGRFEIILDTVGCALAPFHRLLVRKGRMATLALGGAGDVLYLLVSSIHGSRRVRFVQSPPDGHILADLATLVDAGKVKPVIAETYPLAEAARAHRALEAGGGLGKRVIVVDRNGVPEGPSRAAVRPSTAGA